MNIFLKRIICNEIIRLYAFFKRDIFMEKEKEKDFYYSNNNFFIYTHTHTNTDIHISESQTFWNQVNAS